MSQVQCDEPALEDLLGRVEYVTTLAQIIRTCDTPMTLGVFGTWGTGKTSLMRQIQTVLDDVTSAENPRGGSEDVLTVWFDPWMHQFDENPVLALVQTTVTELGLKRSETVKSLLAAVGMGVVGSAASLVGAIDVDQMRRYVDWIEDERFARRDAQVRLREQFEEFVRQAQTNGRKSWWKRRGSVPADERPRLVVFIDDLDRCNPDKVIDLLESLKLYLNVERCVYVLGLDRDPIEAAIEHRYQWAGAGKAAYLDKIIQLPFRLPPIPASAREAYARSLLGDLASETGDRVVNVLVHGVGSNPRQAKRFANTFTLSHLLCRTALDHYEPAVLALVLLIQYRNPALYEILTRAPHRFRELWPAESGEEGEGLESKVGKAAGDSLLTTHVTSDLELASALDACDLTGSEDISPYIALASLSAASSETIAQDLAEIVEEHQKWLRTDGSSGTRALLSDSDLRRVKLRGVTLARALLSGATLMRADLSKADLSGADLSGADLLQADLSGADLSKADLSGADLSGADLSGADLSGADLSGAGLFQADLTKANLSIADLRDVNLVKARLADAKLQGANLTGAQLESTDFTSARYSRHTIWPADFNPPDVAEEPYLGRR